MSVLPVRCRRRTDEYSYTFSSGSQVCIGSWEYLNNKVAMSMKYHMYICLNVSCICIDVWSNRLLNSWLLLQSPLTLLLSNIYLSFIYFLWSLLYYSSLLKMLVCELSLSLLCPHVMKGNNNHNVKTSSRCRKMTIF